MAGGGSPQQDVSLPLLSNQKLKKSKGAEDMLKDVWKFRPVSNRRNRLEKENQ